MFGSDVTLGDLASLRTVHPRVWDLLARGIISAAAMCVQELGCQVLDLSRLAVISHLLKTRSRTLKDLNVCRDIDTQRPSLKKQGR